MWLADINDNISPPRGGNVLKCSNNNSHFQCIGEEDCVLSRTGVIMRLVEDNMPVHNAQRSPGLPRSAVFAQELGLLDRILQISSQLQKVRFVCSECQLDSPE